MAPRKRDNGKDKAAAAKSGNGNVLFERTHEPSAKRAALFGLSALLIMALSVFVGHVQLTGGLSAFIARWQPPPPPVTAQHAADPALAADDDEATPERRAGVRLPAERDLMPASARAEYEISDAEDLPFVKYLLGKNFPRPRERAMGATFRNFYPFDLTMWFDNGTPEGTYSGSIRSLGFSATNTYTTHVFHFKRKDTGRLVTSLTMRDDRHMMILGPEEGDEETLQSKEYVAALEEMEFRKSYFEKHGTPWLSHYPPVLPALSFWPADFVGQVHKLRSSVGYFDEKGEQSPDPVDLLVKVVSVKPRVVLIENVLSPAEVAHVLELGAGVLRPSSVGNSDDGFQSDTRTSENGWISRKKSPLLDRVYDRFADVLNMTDEQASEGRMGNLEQLQFVRYGPSQKYEPHHDFGYSGRPNQRFSTLFMYLKNADSGGATSFPKAFEGRGIKVKPPPGSAVLFYSMLEDGNGDDLSLHSGMAVESGVKVAANLWSWSPVSGTW